VRIKSIDMMQVTERLYLAWVVYVGVDMKEPEVRSFVVAPIKDCPDRPQQPLNEYLADHKRRAESERAFLKKASGMTDAQLERDLTRQD
jgi:hypothetical protein